MKATMAVICLLVMALPAHAWEKFKRTRAAAPVFRSTPGIHVYNANGNHIGLLVGFDGPAIIIFLPNLESSIKLDAGTGDIKTDSIFFKSDDCTGTPYVNSATQYAVIKNCDGTLYTGKREKPEFFLSKSRNQIRNGECACYTVDYEHVFAPAIEVEAQPLGLRLPVPLPLRFQAWSQPPVYQVP